LIDSGLAPDEVIKRIFDFMNYCKVGILTKEGNYIRIKENCESLRTKLYTHIKEPCCYFTGGFLNGVFTAAIQKRVVETRCIVADDPYCEWEIV
jgi:predicted hydrocarbon binding protein